MNKFVEAYTWMYGGTKKHAKEVFKNSNKEYIDFIIKSFEDNFKTAFYND